MQHEGAYRGNLVVQLLSSSIGLALLGVALLRLGGRFGMNEVKSEGRLGY